MRHSIKKRDNVAKSRPGSNTGLNARSIINKKTELNIMVDDIKPHIIGITESWANKDITNAELGLEG